MGYTVHLQDDGKTVINQHNKFVRAMTSIIEFQPGSFPTVQFSTDYESIEINPQPYSQVSELIQQWRDYFQKDDDNDNGNNETDPTLSISPVDAVKEEGDTGTTPFTFEVMREGNTTEEVTVDYMVSSPVLTAVVDGRLPANADDFGGTFPSGTVTLAEGENSEIITVDVTGDLIPEIEEGAEIQSRDIFEVSLSNASDNAVIEEGVATGAILNDDGIDDNETSDNLLDTGNDVAFNEDDGINGEFLNPEATIGDELFSQNLSDTLETVSDLRTGDASVVLTEFLDRPDFLPTSFSLEDSLIGNLNNADSFLL